jgi:hypothetical protein
VISEPAAPTERRHDAALVLLKATLNLIPFGGGSLASLAEFIPTARQRNAEKAIDFFRKRLIDLESRTG